MLEAVLLAAVCCGSPPANARLFLDMVQNNPGDSLGFEQSKYSDPNVQRSLGYSGMVSTGENSISLAVDYSNVLGGWVFPEGSPGKAWLDVYSSALQDWTADVAGAGLGVYFFTDLIVLPKSILENTTINGQILTNGKIDFAKPLTKQLMIAQFSEMFSKFPAASGIVVRTGETYVYENPYHQGNSPIDTVTGSTTDKQNAWADFITFLRDEICVKLNKTVLFRTWDNFDGWASTSGYYLNVTNQVEPHPLLYISVKHTAGDFYRNMEWNPQVGVGNHAQVIEVECQREYEGKMAFPNYVMNGVINGFEEMPVKIGLKDYIPSSQIVKGVWSWSRGGGWWGPYIKGDELWVDVNVATLAHWVTSNGTATEEQIFLTKTCPQFIESDQAAALCPVLYNLSITSATAMLYSHYCPEHPGACWGWTRDDRLGGLDQLSSHFSYVVKNNLTAVSIANKANAVTLWEDIQNLGETLYPHMASPPLARFLKNSLQYGLVLSRIIATGWSIMLQGYAGTPLASLQPLIAQYDQLWAQYSSFRLVTKHMPSLYHGYYFNLPGVAPAQFCNENDPEYADRWSTPQVGMHDSVNKFRQH
eukprot:TRINITY_DN5552_c1_g1_i2.p1 TRINITY_DN5552_c1_g1~~TRINITY_DN5552_c1_g1_i2.p1  ORF type:complete len:604 (+),score=83.66 TRINITY_DN5552_c1_g1_i2:46-1812(+)